MDDLLLYSPKCPEIRAIEPSIIDDLEIENFKLEVVRARKRIGSFSHPRKIKSIRKIGRRKFSIKI